MINIFLTLIFLCLKVSASDNSKYQLMLEAMSENELTRFEAPQSPEDEKTLRAQLLSRFQNPAGPTAGLSKVRLLRQSQTTTLRFKDENYDYEVSYPQGKIHFVLLSLRTYADGKFDLGLASRSANVFQDRMRPLFFLLFLFLVPVFMFTVAYRCFRAKPKFRVLWLMLIFLGLGRFDMDWMTGVVQILPLQMIFLGFQVKPLNGTWILSVAMPLGAFIYLIKERVLDKKL